MIVIVIIIKKKKALNKRIILTRVLKWSLKQKKNKLLSQKLEIVLLVLVTQPFIFPSSPIIIERRNTEKQEEEDEDENINDDTISQKSDGKNREKGLSSKRRIVQKEKNKYDPYAILNKVRSEKFRNKASPDRRFLGHTRSEVRLPQRGDFSPRMSNISVIWIFK